MSDEIQNNIDFAYKAVLNSEKDIDEVTYLLEEYQESLDMMNKKLKARNIESHPQYANLVAIRDSVRDKYIKSCEETLESLKRSHRCGLELKMVAEEARTFRSLSGVLSGPGGSYVEEMNVQDKMKEMRRKSFELQGLVEIRRESLI